MKRLILSLTLLITTVFAFSQVIVSAEGYLIPTGDHPVTRQLSIRGGLHVLSDTTALEDWLKLNSVVLDTTSDQLFYFQEGNWVELQTGGGGIDYDALFNGRTITRDNWDALAGTTYSTLEEVFFPAEPPTASLTLTAFGVTNGSNRTVEITTAGTTNITANWTAGRQATTGLLTTIDVEGNNQSFSQPSQGATVNGTQALTIANNSNTTINLTVNSESGTDTDAQSITWRYKRYWGIDDSGTLTDGELIAGSSEFSTSRSKTFSVNPSSQKVYFSYPTSFGDLTSLKVNDLESIGAFTLTVQSHTNESGGVTNYNVYVSNNDLSGTVNVSTQ